MPGSIISNLCQSLGTTAQKANDALYAFATGDADSQSSSSATQPESTDQTDSSQIGPGSSHGTSTKENESPPARTVATMQNLPEFSPTNDEQIYSPERRGFWEWVLSPDSKLEESYRTVDPRRRLWRSRQVRSGSAGGLLPK